MAQALKFEQGEPLLVTSGAFAGWSVRCLSSTQSLPNCIRDRASPSGALGRMDS